ncbi:MAG: ATP-dependent RecD-like DNA helicase [Deltaproteobacteria bacterium]|nr:ATP-dependent RecD-like DNA helicase [Deltaproteobacteria bacterium]
MTVDLSGQIERITYCNEENGYTIAKVRVQGRPDLVTVVGNLMAPVPGEVLQMQGSWTRHPKYGEQFKVIEYKTKVPATVYGIRKYLSSGLIKGIGPVMAGRIVDRFGDQTLNIMDENIERLAEIQGIGQKRIGMLKQAWHAQKDIRDVMLFLQTHGVSAAYAIKIFKHYGQGSIQVVRKNPYRLATDIFGIGFLTADKIAERLGFHKTSPLRAEAGILYVLNRLAEDGHVYYPYDLLITQCMEILGIEREIVEQALGTLALAGKVVIEDINETLEDFKPNNKAVYLVKFHVAETRIMANLKRILESPKSIRKIDIDRAIEWIRRRLPIDLAEEQVAAIRCVLNNKITVITGGPGTGKTTIINAILKIYSRMKVKTQLAAPTGRAAKRMSETTGHEAKTIHRLLEYSIQKAGFNRNERNHLNCDVLFVDEASMIDTLLMYHLLKAVPSGATLVLVGDVNQLPSVGAGNVLRDLIASHVVPVVSLSEIFRQAKKSQIVVNAHKINMGIIPYVEPLGAMDNHKDFYFIQQDKPEKVLEIILELTRHRIPGRFGLDSVNDIQVLTPMHKGIIGAENLNEALQDALNPGTGGILRGSRRFRISDKVMQIRNNYEKDVFNGDIGRISRIDYENQTVMIAFDGRQVVYDFHDMDEVVLAYAISVHKSQGSEYPAVIMPLLTQHYLLLQRNLVYTAVTRARNLVVIVGTLKALAIGVRNDKLKRRFTYLRQRLSELKL